MRYISPDGMIVMPLLVPDRLPASVWRRTVGEHDVRSVRLLKFGPMHSGSQRFVDAAVHNRTTAASSALLRVTISVVGPVLLFAPYLVRHAISGARMPQDGRAQHSLHALLNRFPELAATMEHSSEFINPGEAVRRQAGSFTSNLVGLLGNSLLGCLDCHHALSAFLS